MKYLFGPVNSRRLGHSLGVDLLPAKICSFNCIYCEVGPTTLCTCRRREYIPTADIIAEIDAFLAADDAASIDVFTITASGEPTLHSGMGRIINHIKSSTKIPVAVLTNGSLLHVPEVRHELALADIVIPSLDAALPDSYRRINRPDPGAALEAIIDGLVRFRGEFQGAVWLEILLARGINDRPEDIEALGRAVRDIRPDKIQLNTVARPPLESFAAPLRYEELREIAGHFDVPTEIVADAAGAEGGRQEKRQVEDTEILHMLKRRPCTTFDICRTLNLELKPTEEFLDKMTDSNHIMALNHNGKKYYQARKS